MLAKKKRQSEESSDPFFNLKYIAWCMSQMPPKGVPTFEEDLVNYAKWVICKKRNKLFYDPVWEKYGSEEIMTEYFGIIFDENPDFKSQFEAEMGGVKKSDLEWFDKMESKFSKKKQEEAKESMGGKEEIEDVF